ncbi:MAG: hypothetical protein QXK06_01215 [Candidatus Diapherotrites archaeon]
MARFNYLQTKIAIALLKGCKDIPQISKMVGEDFAVVEKELKALVLMGIVERKEDAFALKPEIAKEISRRKEIEEQDSFKVRLIASIENQALSEKVVEKNLQLLQEQIKKDPEFIVYNIETGKPQKQGEEYYSGFVEVNFSAKNFNSIIRFILMYSPTVIEVVKPPKAEFTAFDLQEGFMDLSDWVFKYNAFIKSHMERQEIEAFNKTLFQQKKK